jgi:hypothetical protein
MLFAKDSIPKGETREGKVVGVADGDALTLLIDITQYKFVRGAFTTLAYAQQLGNVGQRGNNSRHLWRQLTKRKVAQDLSNKGIDWSKDNGRRTEKTNTDARNGS